MDENNRFNVFFLHLIAITPTCRRIRAPKTVASGFSATLFTTKKWSASYSFFSAAQAIVLKAATKTSKKTATLKSRSQIPTRSTIRRVTPNKWRPRARYQWILNRCTLLLGKFMFCSTFNHPQIIKFNSFCFVFVFFE